MGTLSFERLQPDDLVDHEISELRRGLTYLYEGFGLTQTLVSIGSGHLICYRVDEGGLYRGLIITKTAEWPSGRELIVWLIVGKKLVTDGNFEQAHEFLKGVAQKSGCKFLSGKALHQGLARIYEKRFGPVTSWGFREEIPLWVAEAETKPLQQNLGTA